MQINCSGGVLKPLAVDLCCGKGGWTLGLLDTGWEVIGFDVENHGYPAQLVLQDVRTLDGTRFRGKIDLVVASPPCQEFSYRSFPFARCRYLRDNVPPDTSIWDACVKFAKDAGAPIVLENVRGAVRYMGKAAGRHGPFYLWGDVPALLPDGKPQKGFSKNKERFHPTASEKYAFGGNSYHSRRKNGFAGEYERKNGLKKREFSGVPEQKHHGSKSQVRKEWSAKAAMIPYELAHWFKPKGAK